MRVSLIVLGSRGDVQPFMALGSSLASRGHSVTLATHAEFEELVLRSGLDFVPLPGSMQEFLTHPALVEALQQGASLLRAARKVPRASSELMHEFAAKVAEVAADAELIVNSTMSRISFVDDGHAPWASLTWWPLTPTSRWPAMLAPQVKLGPLYNRLTHRLVGLLEGIVVRKYRKDSGLPALPLSAPYGNLGREVPLLCPVTRTMFTEPSDWPAQSHITGYWFWDPQWNPPQELVDFVDAGTPPVTLTFGSIWPIHSPAKTLDKVLSVVRAHGQRLVMVGGGPERVPDDVYRIDEAHYPWLFSRSSVVIHHGGCNTTGEALRSGTPQVVVPTFADSPFWAKQVHAMGVAAEPIPYPKFTAERLDEALNVALTDEKMRRTAASVGEAVRAEQGVEKAADILEDWAERWRGQRRHRTAH